ncbi:MAG: HAMP domain-containing sensor histidine kinase [Ahrensia sp.]|nr:HAMP domain-containing sensor histidine kinase [Ahrensia sp.]
MERFRRLLSTTAVRLTIIYTVLFGLLALGVVAYISLNTSRLLQSQFQAAVDEEVRQISGVVRTLGLRRLIPTVEGRSRRPGANLYLVADANGRIIAGNVRDLDRALLGHEGWRSQPFEYQRFEDGDEELYRAIARVFTLPGGLKLLVGRDVGDATRFSQIVIQASAVSLIVLIGVALLLWFFVGRRALQRIDEVSKRSEKIIAGDLSQRLPTSGSGDEFDRLSGNLNAIIARIATLDAGVRNMSDSIAHDLKTPLTRLRNAAESALGAKSSKARNAELVRIVEGAGTLIRTFDSLLMISQVESGARPAQMEETELRSVLHDVYELFEPTAEESNVTFLCEIETRAKVHANRQLLAQALHNLLENAFKYAVDVNAPRITLSASQEGNRVEIAVTDNGPGIPPDSLEKVRERFFRLDESRHHPGSGLGLSLVDAVMRLHGGELRLEASEPGKGVERHETSGLKAVLVLPTIG